MKKTIKILLLFLLITINCNCQVTSVVPLRSLASENENGVYIKDLDNELPFYVDTWVGFFNNKKYTFEFVKFTQHLSQYDPNGDYYFKDKLRGKFKVEDLSTGSIIYNDLTITNYNDFKLNLLSLIRGASFSYVDRENCYNSAVFFLYKVSGNPNQLRYENFNLKDFLNHDCPYENQEDIPMFLPQGNFILTRQ